MDWAGTCCAGTDWAGTDSAETFFSETDSAAAASADGGPIRTVNSASSGGIQVLSLQIIHSNSAFTSASGALKTTVWAKRALPEKVPISMPNIGS